MFVFLFCVVKCVVILMIFILKMNSNGKVLVKEENGFLLDDIVFFKNMLKWKYLIGLVIFLGLFGYVIYVLIIFFYYLYNVGKVFFLNIFVVSENSVVCGSNINGIGVENG